MTAGAAVGLGAALVHWRQTFGGGAGSSHAPVSETPIVRYALARTAASLTNVAGLGVGVVLLGVLGNNRDAGLFAAAHCLLGVAGVALAGAASTFAPVAVDLVERAQRARLEALVQTVTAWTATLAFPLLVAVVVAPEPFVWLLTGAPDPMGARAFVLLAAGTAAATVAGPCTYLLAVAGHGRLNTLTSAVTAVAYLGAGAWAAANTGLLGLAVSHGAVIALLGCVRLVQTRVLVGIRPVGRPLAAPLVAAGAAAAVLLVARSSAPATAIGWSASLAAFGATYVAGMWAGRRAAEPPPAPLEEREGK
jgi:O-antigen/teichoic acid export membrane protein